MKFTHPYLCERRQDRDAPLHGDCDGGVHAPCQGDVDQGQQVRQQMRKKYFLKYSILKLVLHLVILWPYTVGLANIRQGVHQDCQHLKHQVIKCLKRAKFIH